MGAWPLLSGRWRLTLLSWCQGELPERRKSSSCALAFIGCAALDLLVGHWV